jgi:predicted RNase H-like nuclease (RuvC/YqgF family)
MLHTDKLSGLTRDELVRFLERHAPGTQLIQVPEAEILAKTKRLRAAFKLPEVLSGGVP